MPQSTIQQRNGDRKVLRTDLPKRIDAARIRLHRVRHALRPLLHEVGILVDREHLAVEALQLSGRRRAEPPQADHEHRCVVRDLVNHGVVPSVVRKLSRSLKPR